MYRRRKFILILLLSLSLYIIATNVQSGWLYLLTAFLLSLLIFSAFRPVFYLSKYEVKREVPPKGSVGEPLTVDLFIKKIKRTAPLIEVRDNFLNSCYQRLLYNVGPKIQKISYQITPQHRGIYNNGSVELSFSAPFGFFRHRKTKEHNSEVIIYPKVIPIKNLYLSTSTFFSSNESKVKKKHRFGQEYYGVRDYRPKDPLRFVHWKSTAKKGQLMIKEYEDEYISHLSIATDLNYIESNGIERNPTEDSLSLAISLANYAQNHGYQTDIYFGKDGYPLYLKNPAWLEILNWSVRIKTENEFSLTKQLALIDEKKFRTLNLALITSSRDDFPWKELRGMLDRLNQLLVFLIKPSSYKLKSKYFLKKDEEKSMENKFTEMGAHLYLISGQEELAECLQKPLNFIAK